MGWGWGGHGFGSAGLSLANFAVALHIIGSAAAVNCREFASRL